jgi:acyl carrier protein
VTTRDELAARVLSLLTEIAPDVEPDAVIASVDFRDQFDFDSMDTLNFAIALHRELGVDVPEADYSQLASLDKCVSYLRSRGNWGHSPVSGERK